MLKNNLKLKKASKLKFNIYTFRMAHFEIGSKALTCHSPLNLKYLKTGIRANSNLDGKLELVES